MDRNTRTLVLILSVVAGMVGLAFASVPLYDMFCRVTGFGGTTQVSKAAPSEDKIIDRDITIHFNGDVNGDLNWEFEPEFRKVSVKVGQQGLITFKAKNNGRYPTIGTAVYNVTPAKAGKYFQKTQCFCFDAQTLKPKEAMDMPVLFYIDPSIVDDKNMNDVQTITLSYSFFESDSNALDSALEEFYNTE